VLLQVVIFNFLFGDLEQEGTRLIFAVFEKSTAEV
jgi:hypothetical protein